MKSQPQRTVEWSENVIVADADYVDHVAFDLIVNFERMLERRIPRADLAQWAVCVALDGGVRESDGQTQLVLVHDKERTAMENFNPSDYERELDAQAFRDTRLGEFVINAVTPESIATKADYIADLSQIVCSEPRVRRVMIIPDGDDAEGCERLRHTLRSVDDEQKHVTLFSMQPMQGGNFRQEILGYSLLNALGIRSDELTGQGQ